MMHLGFGLCLTLLVALQLVDGQPIEEKISLLSGGCLYYPDGESVVYELCTGQTLSRVELRTKGTAKKDTLQVFHPLTWRTHEYTNTWRTSFARVAYSCCASAEGTVIQSLKEDLFTTSAAVNSEGETETSFGFNASINVCSTLLCDEHDAPISPPVDALKKRKMTPWYRLLDSLSEVSKEEQQLFRKETKALFLHAYSAYMNSSFPLDETMPISCKPRWFEPTAGAMLTLIDSLDTLAIMGLQKEFHDGVMQVVALNKTFDLDQNVSVFETTIRILGGLLSAHIFATDSEYGLRIPGYRGELLHLAEDLGRRLLPAFETKTGIPYGTVNLRFGVNKGETSEASTAGGGSLMLEFEMLSRLTGQPVFGNVARRAAIGLAVRVSSMRLTGKHIDVHTGRWSEKVSGIGSNSDSFFEYLEKYYELSGDPVAWSVFQNLYKAVESQQGIGPWITDVDMEKGSGKARAVEALGAFWGGMQVSSGEVEEASWTTNAFHRIWYDFQALPERFDISSWKPFPRQAQYFLRPELVESTYHMYTATRDRSWFRAGREILRTLQSLKSPCGIVSLEDVVLKTASDQQPSFLLGETLKYLYLLFADTDSVISATPFPANPWKRSSRTGASLRDHIFTTEAHVFPILIPEYYLPLYGYQHLLFLGSNDLSKACSGVSCDKFLPFTVKQPMYNRISLSLSSQGAEKTANYLRAQLDLPPLPPMPAAFSDLFMRQPLSFDDILLQTDLGPIVTKAPMPPLLGLLSMVDVSQSRFEELTCAAPTWYRVLSYSPQLPYIDFSSSNAEHPKSVFGHLDQQQRSTHSRIQSKTISKSPKTKVRHPPPAEHEMPAQVKTVDAGEFGKITFQLAASAFIALSHKYEETVEMSNLQQEARLTYINSHDGGFVLTHDLHGHSMVCSVAELRPVADEALHLQVLSKHGCTPSGFGPQLLSPLRVRGEPVLAMPATACEPLHPHTFSVPQTSQYQHPWAHMSSKRNRNPYLGRVVLVMRGECAFETKVTHATAAGAAAVVVINPAPDAGLFVMSGKDPDAAPELPYLASMSAIQAQVSDPSTSNPLIWEGLLDTSTVEDVPATQSATVPCHFSSLSLAEFSSLLERYSVEEFEVLASQCAAEEARNSVKPAIAVENSKRPLAEWKRIPSGLPGLFSRWRSASIAKKAACTDLVPPLSLQSGEELATPGCNVSHPRSGSPAQKPDIDDDMVRRMQADMQWVAATIDGGEAWTSLWEHDPLWSHRIPLLRPLFRQLVPSVLLNSEAGAGLVRSVLAATVTARVAAIRQGYASEAFATWEELRRAETEQPPLTGATVTEACSVVCADAALARFPHGFAYDGQVHHSASDDKDGVMTQCASCLQGLVADNGTAFLQPATPWLAFATQDTQQQPSPAPSPSARTSSTPAMASHTSAAAVLLTSQRASNALCRIVVDVGTDALTRPPHLFPGATVADSRSDGGISLSSVPSGLSSPWYRVWGVADAAPFAPLRVSMDESDAIEEVVEGQGAAAETDMCPGGLTDDNYLFSLGGRKVFDPRCSTVRPVQEANIIGGSSSKGWAFVVREDPNNKRIDVKVLSAWSAAIERSEGST